LTNKGTLWQVYRLEVQSSQVGCFDPALWTVSPLTFSLVQLYPPPLFPLWINILYTHIQFERGGDEVLGLRQINTCRKVPFQVNSFRWRHFALPSIKALSFYVAGLQMFEDLRIIWPFLHYILYLNIYSIFHFGFFEFCRQLICRKQQGNYLCPLYSFNIFTVEWSRFRHIRMLFRCTIQ